MVRAVEKSRVFLIIYKNIIEYVYSMVNTTVALFSAVAISAFAMLFMTSLVLELCTHQSEFIIYPVGILKAVLIVGSSYNISV